MALMFARLAHNFIKNGYFPTDEVTLERVIGAIEAEERVSIIDPCCGEGYALAELGQHLRNTGTNVHGYGIEFDSERAWHAKRLLDTVIHADTNDVVVGARTMGLLFLNPPYGDALSDHAQLSTGASGRKERLEKQFYRLSIPWLAFGGLMVFVVPHYAIDTELAGLIARHFSQVRIFLAAEQRFRQVVLFGVKRRADTPDPALARQLEEIGRGSLLPELPEVWPYQPYRLPNAQATPPKFQAIRIDAPQLQAELERISNQTLWQQFSRTFGNRALPARRPLCAPSDWHMALALAAGQLQGVVTSEDGRQLLITGDTYKEKSTATEFEEGVDGDLTEVRIMTDRFIPIITGIDFTPGEGYGDIVTIR